VCSGEKAEKSNGRVTVSVGGDGGGEVVVVVVVVVVMVMDE
jgi:hypothetical protein